MDHKPFLRLFLILIALTVLNLTLIVLSTGYTIVSTSPEYVYSFVHQSLTVNITVQGVTDLCSWQMMLSYNPHILNCTDVFIPDDNIFSGYTTTFGFEIDDVNGSLEIFNGIWAINGVSGSGKLCSITFQATTPGISAFSFLSEGYLRDSENDPIPFESVDGTIQINGEGFNSYSFNITQGETSYNITLLSNSSITDFFNSTLQKIIYHASSVEDTMGSGTISIPRALLNGTFAILVNDSSIYYSISENALNQYLHYNYLHPTAESLHMQIVTTIIGDLNGDREVDMKDIGHAARAFGSTPGHPRWDARADISGPNGYPEGQVDMRDIGIFARNFGNSWNP